MYISYDHLEDKFRDEGYPYWKLYEGRSTRKCVARNLSLENIDESWDLLEKKLGYYENGTFTLETLSSPKANNSSAIISSFKIGDGGSVGRTHSRQPSNQRSPMMEFMQMFTLMQKMGNDQMSTQVKLMQESIRGEYENQRLLDRIHDLENAEPQGDPMINDMKEVIGMLTGGQPLFNMNGTRVIEQPAQIGVAGQKSDSEQPAPSGKRQLQKGVYDLNHLNAVARKLEDLYPEYHPNMVLDGLLHFIMHNKPTADNIIHQLMKPHKAASNEE